MAIGSILVYGILALVVVGSSIGLLVSRNAIYAALFLVLNFVTVGMLYLALGAPFIALAQITVYAGSIMVLFLFVIMLLGAERLPFLEPLRGQRVLGLFAGLAFLVEMVLFIVIRNGGLGTVGQAPEGFSTPAQIGILLFDKYLLPFEVISVLLLTAVIGAIILTRPEKSRKDLTTAPSSETKE